MAKLWRRKGRLLRGDDGKLIRCDECPCSEICTWQELESYTAEDGYPALRTVDKSAPCKTFYVNSQPGNGFYTGGIYHGAPETGTGTKSNPFINLNSVFLFDTQGTTKKRIYLTGIVDYYIPSMRSNTLIEPWPPNAESEIQPPVFTGTHPYDIAGGTALIFPPIADVIFKGCFIYTYLPGLTYKDVVHFTFCYNLHDGCILNDTNIYYTLNAESPVASFIFADSFGSSHAIRTNVHLSGSAGEKKQCAMALFSNGDGNEKIYDVKFGVAQQELHCDLFTCNLFTCGGIIEKIDCDIKQNTILSEYDSSFSSQNDSFLLRGVSYAAYFRDCNIAVELNNNSGPVGVSGDSSISGVSAFYNSNVVLLNSNIKAKISAYGWVKSYGAEAVLILNCNITSVAKCIGPGMNQLGQAIAAGVSRSNSVVTNTTLSVSSEINEEKSYYLWTSKHCIYVGDGYSIHNSTSPGSSCVECPQGTTQMCTYDNCFGG